MAIASASRLIGEGGPLRRIEARCKLVHPSSQILASLAITWIPVVILGFATELLTADRVPLLHDLAMHVRLLVATPLLLFLDRIFPIACTKAVEQLPRSGFIREHQRPQFERLLARVRRLSDWWVPELIIAIYALCFGASTLPFDTTDGVRLRTSLTPAEWWYALIGLPLFEFLLFRSLWRWAIWVRAVVGLSRLDLDLDATHPDRCCGISFLRKPSLAYCALLLFAMSSVLSSGWVARFEIVSWTSFVPLILVIAVVATLIAFGPLLLFGYQLHRAKAGALDTLGDLAARSGRWFHERLAECAPSEALSRVELQNLTAIAATYRETVQQVRPVLFRKKDLLLVLFAALLPVVPPVIGKVPHDGWLAMASFLFGKSLPL